jgi:hypothetical protein
VAYPRLFLCQSLWHATPRTKSEAKKGLGSRGLRMRPFTFRTEPVSASAQHLKFPKSKRHILRHEALGARSTGIAYGWVFGLAALSFSKS